MQEIGNPKPTHSDMALIPAQGREQAAIDQDVAGARAAEHARRMGSNQAPEWVYDPDQDADAGCDTDADAD